ncbi:MAG TPA: PAS domain S-box protein [Candidatus Acidoferrales bacterium]|nr:PAS domain S-box protein [Candidatus Acidoferrales bacterium]
MTQAGERLRGSALFGYGLAFLSVGTALVLSLVLLHFDSPLPFTGFALTAIAITFWYNSTKPAIFAVFLSTLLRSYFFQPVGTAASRVLYDSVFLGFALLMIWITRERNELEATVAERTAGLMEANEKLSLEISERKQAEEALRQAEHRHRLVLDTTPALIHAARPDGYLDYFNQPWLNYTGRSLEELQGWAWTATVHPEDVDAVLEKWRASLASGEPLLHEARVRRADGEYRWMTHHKVPLRDQAGNIVHWYGSSVDIEDRKRADEDLWRLSGQLLRLQDDERRRIAQDLHDSTGQDLVALATMVGQLRGSIPPADPESTKLLSECNALAERCIRDVRTLSFLLHPPVLDQAGLGDAIREYADGFAERSGIQVELELSPVLGRMPRDVELALFRIVQEALTNIQRHSGSQQAKIRIDRNSELTLEISDPGRGFSSTAQRGNEATRFEVGVGIPSMRERVKLIRGRFDIVSTSRGTTVRVTIPLDGERT